MTTGATLELEALSGLDRRRPHRSLRDRHDLAIRMHHEVRAVQPPHPAASPPRLINRSDNADNLRPLTSSHLYVDSQLASLMISQGGVKLRQLLREVGRVYAGDAIRVIGEEHVRDV